MHSLLAPPQPQRHAPAGLFAAIMLTGALACGLLACAPAAQTAWAQDAEQTEEQPAEQTEQQPASGKTPTATPKRLGKKSLVRLAAHALSSRSVKAVGTSYKLTKRKAGKRLVNYVKKLQKRYKVGIVMLDVNSGAGITCAAKRSMYSASVLKGPYVAAINKYRRSGVTSSAKRLMRSTIVVSDNDDYKALRDRFGSGIMKRFHKYSGIAPAGYASRYRHLSTSALARLWVGTYWYFYRDKNKNSAWARSLYTHGAQSFIYRAMKGKAKVHAKAGWYPRGSGKAAQNDAGIVCAKVGKKSRPYILAVMTNAYGEHAKLRKLVRLVDGVHADMVKTEKDAS